MGSPTAKRRLVIYVILIGCGLAVCAWQVEEHLRFRAAAREALINRGRDITSTLGVLVSAQRRGGYVSKNRLESALQDLIRPEELKSVAILSANGGVAASAGEKMDITPEMLQAKGVFWRDSTLTIMNLADLGVTNDEDGSRPRPAIVVSGSFRPPQNRRPVESSPAPDPAAETTAPAGDVAPTTASTATPTSTATNASTPPSVTPPTTAAPSSSTAGTTSPPSLNTSNATSPAPTTPSSGSSRPRFAFGRPS